MSFWFVLKSERGNWMTNLDILGPGSKTAKRLTNGMNVYFFESAFFLNYPLRKSIIRKLNCKCM